MITLQSSNYSVYYLTLPRSTMCVHRVRCSLSPCSPGPWWVDGCWTVERSITAGGWSWRGFLQSSTAPCSAACPRILLDLQTLTHASFCLVRTILLDFPSLHLFSAPVMNTCVCFHREPKTKETTCR